jgi:hypothetical protein
MLQRIETFLTHLNSPLCVIPNKDTTNRCVCSQVCDSVCQPTVAYSPMETKNCHHLTLCSNTASQCIYTDNEKLVYTTFVAL